MGGAAATLYLRVEFAFTALRVEKGKEKGKEKAHSRNGSRSNRSYSGCSEGAERKDGRGESAV